MAKKCIKCNGRGQITLRGGGLEFGCSGHFEGGRTETCPRCKGTGEEPGCFVSTAICNGLGKPDDCDELFILRTFRDSYLMPLQWGRKLVSEYYQISPALTADLLREGEHDPSLFEKIYRNHLLGILDAIHESRYSEAVTRYEKMLTSIQTTQN